MNRSRPIRTATTDPLIDRLAAFTVVAPSGCWVWVGCRTNGYGRLWLPASKQSAYAHRLSYQEHVGPIPDGLEIDHLCRNRACINPRHLQAVASAVNIRRGTSPGAAARRRDHCAAGHSFAEHGVIWSGRRVCRPCRTEYLRRWNALGADERARRRANGGTVVGRIERTS